MYMNTMTLYIRCERSLMNIPLALLIGTLRRRILKKKSLLKEMLIPGAVIW